MEFLAIKNHTVGKYLLAQEEVCGRLLKLDEKKNQCVLNGLFVINKCVYICKKKRAELISRSC